MSAQQQIHDRRWWILAILSLSLLVISLDNTILNVALPSIQTDLDADSGQLSWIIDSYMLVFAGLLLTAGSLGDRFGRRGALVGGLALFGGASALSALATSPEQLIATRALMGIGGAFIMPTTLSILTNVFPAEERAKAIGIWSAVAGLGIAIGPVSGGFLVEQFDWSAVFLVNVPIVILALMGVFRWVPASRNPEDSPLDLVGAGLSVAGLTGLVWGIIQAPADGWTHPSILAAFGIGAALLAAFVAWELRTEHPMLDVRVFRNGSFTAASAAIGLVFFAMMGLIFVLTQYLQDSLGYSPLEAGIRMLPLAAGMLIAAPNSARLSGRFGARRIVPIGLGLVAAGLALLSTVDASSGYSLTAIAELVIALGIGTAMAPATESVMSALPRSRAGVGSAMNDTTRLVGGAFGAAIAGSILSSLYGGNMDAAAEGLPGSAADSATNSIGGASAVAERIGGSAGQALHHASQVAFVDAMSTVMLVAAAVALAGAAIALAFLPERAREPQRTVGIDELPAQGAAA